MCLVAAACADSHSSQPVQFADLAFELPDTWTETSGAHADYRMWVPTDNARHESIVLIRSTMPPGLAVDSLGQLLEDAQDGLGQSRAQATITITGAGLRGARVEFDYVPPGSHDTYHRVHTVLVDRDSFVHVLYTAKSAEPELSTLGGVLRTLHQT
jgi:hypothetical protein